jgi:sugar phosphate isomerase/epimerase
MALPLAAAGLLPADPGAAGPAIAKALDLGLAGVSWHLPALDAFTHPEIRDLRARLADAGLALAQLLPPSYASLVDPDRAQREAGLEALARCGELALLLEADNVYVRPGSLNPAGPWLPHPGNHRPEVRERLRESLGAAARRAEEQGVTLAVEGHVLSPVESPETAGALLRSVASPALRFNLDVVNFVDGVDTAYDASGLVARLFEQVGAFIQATHLKDVEVEERLVVHIEETLPGRGLLDLPGLLRQLREARPQGWLIIEHLREEELPEAVAAVRRAAEAVGWE